MQFARFPHDRPEPRRDEVLGVRADAAGLDEVQERGVAAALDRVEGRTLRLASSAACNLSVVVARG
jgi:hypothetical protein